MSGLSRLIVAQHLRALGGTWRNRSLKQFQGEPPGSRMFLLIVPTSSRESLELKRTASNISNFLDLCTLMMFNLDVGSRMCLLKDSKWQCQKPLSMHASCQKAGINSGDQLHRLLSSTPDFQESSCTSSTPCRNKILSFHMENEGLSLWRADQKKEQSDLYKQATKESVLDAQRHSYCTHMKILLEHQIASSFI